MGRETHREVGKAHSGFREGMGGPLRCPRGVGMHTQRCGSGWVAHLEVQEWSEGPPGGL